MLTVELRPVDSIRPYDRNPRKNDAAVEHVVRSIRTYGWRQPLVVDKDGVIVVGHTRLKAAIQMGLTEVPVHVAHDLTPEQAKAYRIADKRVPPRKASPRARTRHGPTSGVPGAAWWATARAPTPASGGAGRW